MPDHAKVLLVEYTVPTGPEPCLAKALDLRTLPYLQFLVLLLLLTQAGTGWTDMMALAGAKERTKEEYAVLFRAAGLELTQVAGPHAVNVIEARPAQ
jgi:hypothetical protein